MSAHVLNRDRCQLEAQLCGRLRDADGGRLATLKARALSEIPEGVLVPRGGGHLLPPGPLIRTLLGHGGPVEGALVLPDGRALSWSTEATLRLWDLEAGTGVPLEGHVGWVHGALVLPDGRALSWSWDGTLRLWDLEAGTGVPLEGHGAWVQGALVLPDGRALSWSLDATLRLWDLEAGPASR